MATRVRIVFVTCLLVFILMDANPVLAKRGGGGKYKKLEARVKTLEGENEWKTCESPLGMESGLIQDAQITSSSQWDDNHAAKQGRLNFQAGGGKAGGWSARTNNGSQWIQVALPSDTKITRFSTQGRNAQNNQWVTKYKLQYSDDGVTFQYYGQGSPKEFTGNQDRDTVVYHELSPPIQARFVRIIPTAWNGHISMRMELYGCNGMMNISPGDDTLLN